MKKHTRLVAKCDACGQEGKLRQSLPLLGEVKYFCDLKCVLNFCNKKFQMVDTVSSPPRPAGSVASSPVIAGAFASQLITSVGSAQTVSASDIQTKVVGHASVQTAPKELRNKSMLCTPLVHNKGVSCTTQTVNKDAQTDNFVPKVVVLPLPLPVYVPLPLNLYSQFTPQPVGLPLPLPVPVFLPVTPDSFDPTGKSSKERVQSYVLEGELSSKSEMKKIQDDRNKREDGQKDRVVTKDRQRREVHIHKEHTNNFSGELEKNHHSTFIRKNSFSDSSFSSLSRPHTHNKTPPVSEVRMPSEPQPELPPPPPPPRPPALEIREDVQALSPSQQTVGKGHNKNKGRKLQQFSKADKEETSQRGFSRHHRLRSQSGIDAWKRWIQWRELQNSLDLVSSRAVTFNEDVLLCSAIELNDGLCCFITEVKRPDGEPYAPDHLFYLCLSIQQYLFENGRLENIFSDLIYRKFSAQFNRILRGFKPSITAGGYVHSRVEEEFLWDCKQLGAYSPIVLLNTLLFFCCKYFGFTTVEQHHQLSFAHVRRCTRTNQDYTQTTFLRFYPPIAMNAADGVPAKKRKKDESDEENILEMMENTENPLRCPVRLYEFYLSKCSPLVRQCTNLFYLQPDCSCVPSSPLWFSSTPLDDSTVEAMLLRALTVRELQGGDTGGVDQQTSDDEDDSE
ncbi:zinc finger MYM-type protein 4-like [Symphorus nematophorus]